MAVHGQGDGVVPEQGVQPVVGQAGYQTPGQRDGVEKVDPRRHRAVLALVVEKSGLGGGVLGHQQVSGVRGEAAIQGAQGFGRRGGRGEVLGGEAAVEGVEPGHRCELRWADQGGEASRFHPVALLVAQCESRDLDGLSRTPRRGGRLEIDDHVGRRSKVRVVGQRAHTLTVATGGGERRESARYPGSPRSNWNGCGVLFVVGSSRHRRGRA